MDALKKHKDEVEKQIVETMIDGLEKKKLEEADTAKISKFVLESIDKVSTHDQLIGLVSHLAVKWPVFENLAVIEESEVRSSIEHQTTAKVLEMIKTGQTAGAVALAKTAMGK